MNNEIGKFWNTLCAKQFKLRSSGTLVYQSNRWFDKENQLNLTFTLTFRVHSKHTNTSAHIEFITHTLNRNHIVAVLLKNKCRATTIRSPLGDSKNVFVAAHWLTQSHNHCAACCVYLENDWSVRKHNDTVAQYIRSLNHHTIRSLFSSFVIPLIETWSSNRHSTRDLQ